MLCMYLIYFGCHAATIKVTRSVPRLEFLSLSIKRQSSLINSSSLTNQSLRVTANTDLLIRHEVNVQESRGQG